MGLRGRRWGVFGGSVWRGGGGFGGLVDVREGCLWCFVRLELECWSLVELWP